MNTKLEPGTYKLTKDITNPKPDRRQRHDWRAEPVWKAGRLFRVAVSYWGKDSDHQNLELWAGRYQHMNASDMRDDGLWETIAANLERVDEKPSQWILREHGEHSGAPWGVLDMLVAEGRMSFEEIQEFVNRYYENLKDD